MCCRVSRGTVATLSAEHLDAVARGIEHVVRRTGEPVDSEVIDTLESGLVGQAIAGSAPSEIVERLITALDSASRPRPEPDGSDDKRPIGRRRADAFGQLLECGTRGLSPDALSGPPRTEILVTIPLGLDIDTTVVTAGTASLTWMGPITELSAKLLTCDARLAGVGIDLNGAPVSVAAPEPRLFAGAARKVVLYRDQGCIMGADRHPWLIPPASIDPQRRPRPAHNRRTLRLDDPIAA